ncbi:hypothetical protein O6H91_12G076900 [Diphasiastrum complanatum]|uniref:Uncharacterized protein n=2 Tax=Diphasiastrum complanatum TaxID=34168 RepID=A0ACC2C3T7_DIPCM|nr:hypothetical protein O6H91_Y138700 [Diphasiastrum complanatum]KAJ7296192.1 hypothetical protein O6H91_Y138700 [Diphasiastrum complanatum]KAJ7536666.1 hypothetical protein O6H91_12G076900 [Diphasiastrum complanatum]KAJ7536667.1 hypothetical protein O6H91_12G076900 [Diphasiastrum complanatum]
MMEVSAVEAPIKQRSIDQRKAEQGEPECVVCGLYGEYICDETDDDVCSLECKAIVVSQKLSSSSFAVSNPQATSITPSPAVHPIAVRVSISATDECIIVSDGQKKLPEWQPEESMLTIQQIDALRRQIEISLKGDAQPPPILEFSNCKFNPKLQDNLTSAGYETPTPVQMQALPAALKGRDVLVSADTGSGKTLAFLLPIISKSCMIRMWHLSERAHPLAIVLAPTRELAAQVEEQAKALAKGLPFKTALVVGGDAMPQQIYRIKNGVELIVGTPGRLIDLLSKHDVSLEDVCMLVLDEVDCMLERGFRDQVMQIVQALYQPQIMLFSATIPPAIESFAATILKQPLLISAGRPSLPNKAIRQTVIWVECKSKKKKLFEILQSSNHFQPPAVIFVNSRMGADLLAEAIQTVTGLRAAALHGEKSMQERRHILKAFLLGEQPVIVATGVLGRGLDLLRATQVIIFDMPNSLEEYVHQIGRASRLGIPGSAIVFINNDSKVLFKGFIKLLRETQVFIPPELSNSPYAHSAYAVAYNSKKRRR